MKRALLGLCLTLTVFEAHAISRYTTTAMTCGQVQAALNNDGAAILRYQSTRDPSLPLYGRYVRTKQFCQIGEYADTAYVPTRDRKSCTVRKCIAVEFDPDR